MKNKLFVYFTLIAFFCSCASRESIIYYQNTKDLQNFAQNFDTKIQPDDLLMIIVSAKNPLAVQHFNLTTNLSVDPTNQAGTAQRQQQLYLVDKDGYIDFPVLGKIKVSEMSKDQIVDFLKKEISKEVKDVIINLRLMNFKITVHGEVNKPGIHKIITERITLPEALALSGDLTKYGKRENILVIREENNEIKTHRIDLTKINFIDSDFYYLKQNDVVYVEPNKVAINSTAVGPNISIYLSAFSLLLTTAALILTNTRK